MVKTAVKRRIPTRGFAKPLTKVRPALLKKMAKKPVKKVKKIVKIVAAVVKIPKQKVENAVPVHLIEVIPVKPGKKVKPIKPPKEPTRAAVYEALIAEAEAKGINCSLARAIELNGWDPKNPPPRKSGHYMDPREFTYYCIKCQIAGSCALAGYDGERFVELCALLAEHFMGRIRFRSNGEMSNLHDEIIAAASSKCAMVVTKFRPWAVPGTTLASSFAYFTSITRNASLECVSNPILTGHGQIYLEDLRADNQGLGDIV